MNRRTLRILLVFSICLPAACLPFSLYGAETSAFTMEEAVERALKHNKGIISAREKVKESEAAKSVARARFFPYLSASGSYTRFEMQYISPTYGMLTLPVFDNFGIPTGDVVMAPGATGTENLKMLENVYDLRLSLQYPVFTWGRISNAYKISSLSLDIAKEDLRKKEIDVRFSVIESFIRVQLTQKSLELARESMEQLRQHAEQAGNLYDAGKISKLDFLRARVQFSAMQVQVAQAKNGLALTIDALKNLLGIKMEDGIVIRGELEYAPYEASLSDAIAAALANRPEIRSMDMNVEIVRRSLDIARAGNKPSVVLNGNYDYKNPAGSGIEEWGTDWSATLAVSIPLFQGGEITGKIKQAEAQLEQVKLGKEQLEEGIKMEIKSAFLQLSSSRELLASQQENIKEAKEAMGIAEERYAGGLITNLESLDAQVALSRAEMDYIRTLADYLTAKARLEKAMSK